MLDDLKKLQLVVNLLEDLAKVNDLDMLLGKILTGARYVMNADAGSIYVREGDTLDFSHAQNVTLSKRLKPGEKLIYTKFSIPIDHSTIAGYSAQANVMLNIPDVYQLPPHLPYSFGTSFDEKANYRTQSMLTVPLHTSLREVVGVLQLINKQDRDGTIIPFTDEDERMAGHFANNAGLALERAQMTRKMILRMISMAELRDPKETGPHVNRVAAYAVEIYETWAQARHVPEDELERNCDVLRMAAMVHDIGKVAISDAILRKPGAFTPEEREVMKGHTHLGAQLFDLPVSGFDVAAAQVALNHHENWDGSGYPGPLDPQSNVPLATGTGKAGEEIPLFGRIVAVADVYDALRSRRVYKPAYSEEETLEIIRNDAGKKFDPEVVEAFFASLDTIHRIGDLYPDASASRG